MKKKAVIINNIGTPDAAEPQAVARYLKEFLMDPEILTMPKWVRWALVNLLIVPRRRFASAEKYQKIWQSEGSPLMILTESFARRLQTELGEDYVVKIGMRYGRPSIQEAIQELKAAGIHRLLFAPLYPQYAKATSYSAEAKFQEVLSSNEAPWESQVLAPFYRLPKFIELSADRLRNELKQNIWQHVVFSFHGLPEAQVKKLKGCQANDTCCAQVERCELNCYRAQSIWTAKAIAKAAGVQTENFSISFQSRLGPAKWIGPATRDVVFGLADKGYQKILVQTPSFVVDCLETLEEIAIELRNEFVQNGGQELRLVACLNDDEPWVKAFASLVRSRF